jgi:LemA protein
MNKALIAGICIAIIASGLGLWGILLYNSFVELQVQAQSAYKTIDIEYERKITLIPSLLATVQSMSNFEQETLTQIVALRVKAEELKQAYATANSVSQKVASASAIDELAVSVSNLGLTVEQYPQLRSIQGYLSILDELSVTQNRITTAQLRYNEVVAQYNIQIAQFPGILFSQKPLPFFEPERFVPQEVELK